ncbi:MAG: 50S ribosomal protein L23 [Calditrichaeota bacterium]|nr:MAG: 50S ribosomal protein L23 [Calditrichota bacterium]
MNKTPETILRRPLLTEKAMNLQEKRHQYAFEVLRNANKIEIKQAVEAKFDVTVEGVRTIVVKGKSKRLNTRRGLTFGKRSTWKKAIVTLKEGDTIELFEAGL